MFYVNMP